LIVVSSVAVVQVQETRMSDQRPGLVLHVDDEADSRNGLGAVLQLSGFREVAAKSPEDALGAARSLAGELDVLIVDYHLSADVTGTELAESIARTLGRALPTIILTGDPANAEVPLLSNAPVWMISKPVYPELLCAALPSLVEFNRTIRHFEAPEHARRNWERASR
jgi:CheY-like chemotaxis protein